MPRRMNGKWQAYVRTGNSAVRLMAESKKEAERIEAAAKKADLNDTMPAKEVRAVLNAPRAFEKPRYVCECGRVCSSAQGLAVHRKACQGTGESAVPGKDRLRRALQAAADATLTEVGDAIALCGKRPKTERRLFSGSAHVDSVVLVEHNEKIVVSDDVVVGDFFDTLYEHDKVFSVVDFDSCNTPTIDEILALIDLPGSEHVTSPMCLRVSTCARVQRGSVKRSMAKFGERIVRGRDLLGYNHAKYRGGGKSAMGPIMYVHQWIL